MARAWVSACVRTKVAGRGGRCAWLTAPLVFFSASRFLCRFSKMVGKMGKIGLTKEGTLQNLMRNPQQMMSKVQTMMDPRILRQLGGAGNMVNLIKEVQLAPPINPSACFSSFLLVFFFYTPSLSGLASFCLLSSLLLCPVRP